MMTALRAAIPMRGMGDERSEAREEKAVASVAMRHLRRGVPLLENEGAST